MIEPQLATVLDEMRARNEEKPKNENKSPPHPAPAAPPAVPAGDGGTWIMSEEIETLHKPFIKFLRAEKLPYIRARSDKQSTIAKGAHDFTVFCGNRCLCIEFKAKGNSLDPDQKTWKDAMAMVGATVWVLRDLAAAVEMVQHWKSAVETPAAPHTNERATIAWKGISLRQEPDGSFTRA